jgi:hypothetical protein
MSLAIFIKEAASERAASENDSPCADRLANCWGESEKGASEFGDFRSALGKFGMSAQAGADGSATGEIEHPSRAKRYDRHHDEQAHVAGEFWPVRVWRPANGCGRFSPRRQTPWPWRPASRNFDSGSRRRDVSIAAAMHGGGESVIGRLRHVHVVVGMNGLLGAHLAARDLMARLEMTPTFCWSGVPLPVCQMRRGKCRSICRRSPFKAWVIRDFSLESLPRSRLTRVGFLEDAECTNEFRRHGVPANGEMDQERAVCAP